MTSECTALGLRSGNLHGDSLKYFTAYLFKNDHLENIYNFCQMFLFIRLLSGCLHKVSFYGL